MKKLITTILALFTMSTFASVLMSPDFGSELCEAWNMNDTLTKDLSDWMDNNLGRGYKVMLMKRNDCESSPMIQLTLQKVDGLVWCTYGGIATHEANDKADYIMTADTKHWVEMGNGEYGPAKAMLTGKLKFKGPKGEAMANIKPFGSFLTLIAEPQGDASVCPQ